jgi:hypothetical protein
MHVQVLGRNCAFWNEILASSALPSVFPVSHLSCVPASFPEVRERAYRDEGRSETRPNSLS